MAACDLAECSVQRLGGGTCVRALQSRSITARQGRHESPALVLAPVQSTGADARTRAHREREIRARQSPGARWRRHVRERRNGGEEIQQLYWPRVCLRMETMLSATRLAR